MNRNKRSFPTNDEVRLNKFLSNAGVCSRREADVLIEMGMVQVNGKVVTEMGFKVSAKDEVRYDGQRLSGQAKVYILINKPKGFIATRQGGNHKKSIQELIRSAGVGKLPPLTELGRPMTGLVLLTNDQNLQKRLQTSPKKSMVYRLVLDKNIAPLDLKSLLERPQLYQKTLQIKALSHVQGGTRREIGVEALSVDPREIQQWFKSEGYTVEQLDCVLWSGLTKKDLARGQWRYLSTKEVERLHMI